MDKYKLCEKKVPTRATHIELVKGTWYKLTMANGEIANVTITPDFIDKILKNDFSPEAVRLDTTGKFIEFNSTQHRRISTLLKHGLFDIYDEDGNHAKGDHSLGGVIFCDFVQSWDPLNPIDWEQLTDRIFRFVYADMKVIKFALGDKAIGFHTRLWKNFLPCLRNHTMQSEGCHTIGVIDYRGWLQDVFTPWHDRLDAEYDGVYCDCIMTFDGKYVPLTEENFRTYCSTDLSEFEYPEEFYEETQGQFEPQCVVTLEECLIEVRKEAKQKRDARKAQSRQKAEAKKLRMREHEKRMREARKKSKRS